jgi:hypothetical protein
MLLSLLLPLIASTTASAITEEQRLVQIAKHLKPISDSQWNEIAGARTSEIYEIQKGDTLWDVSKRIFGNSYYWPKVWSLNAGIANPHIVSPGQKLAFMPGSSESLPKLAAADSAPNSSGTSSGTIAEVAAQGDSVTDSGGSVMHEYDKVPKDAWAPITLANTLEKQYDTYGIDKELKITIPSRFVFRVPAIANEAKVPFLGEIVGSRRDAAWLSQHETVFLKSSSQDLQVGTTYTIMNAPEEIRERKSDRVGYIYKAIGEVRIVGVKDELYVGVITNAYDLIPRGSRLYPLLPLITEIKPVAARSAMEALVALSTTEHTKNSAQYHFVHFDRGIEDGVQVGNVFRIYDYFDPNTRKKLTESDFLINADAIVVHATAQYSTAMVLRSRDTFSRGDFGVLLTDVSDLERQINDRSRDLIGKDEQTTLQDKELDELDALDRASGEGLGKKEETEIKELDHWDKTKDMQNNPSQEPTTPSGPEAPTDEANGAPAKPSDAELDDKPSAPPAQAEPELFSPKSQAPESQPMVEPAPNTQSGAPAPEAEPAPLPAPEPSL